METIHEIIVVEDRVDMQCVRHVHWMGNSPSPVPSPNTADADIWRGVQWVREAGVWHLRWSGPYRGVIDIPAACVEGKVRRLVAWSLADSGERLAFGLTVRQALHEAAREFERLFGGRAQFGFMRRLPRSAFSNEQSAISRVVEVGDLTLLEAEWMLERCVAVGGRAVGF